MTTTDDDLDALPSAPRTGGLGSLLFQQPAQDEDLIPSPSSSPETTSPHDPAASSPSASGSLSEPSAGLSDDDPTSSPESSGRPAGLLAGPKDIVGKQALQRTFRQGVKTTGQVGHKFLARTEGQRLARVYLADEEDAAGIGNPLANIAHRRGGVVGEMSEDANDALAAIMALGGYVAKQMAALQEASQYDQAHRPTPVAGPEGGVQ